MQHKNYDTLQLEIMKQLHAYWRMPYIETKNLDTGHKQLFRELPNKSDAESHIIWRGAYTFLVINAIPYSPGHLLLVPYREVATMLDLNSTERAEFMDALIMAQELLTFTFKPDGFNIGLNIGSAGGASIPNHIHCHIVPRWNGDTNFMPVIADTQVLPESIDNMWARLKKYLTEMKGHKSSS